MRPILAVTVPIKKIKGSASQRNVVTVGVDEPLKLVHTNSQRYRQREKRYVEGQMGMRPILAVTVPIKKINGAVINIFW